jgi:uncharacterized OB-fold protein
MASLGKEKIPVRSGLWDDSSDSGGSPRLIASQCADCGELFFPKKDNGICTFCQSKNMAEIRLSKRGTIYSFTVVMLRPPVYYKGEVPYAMGFVELPEGIRIQTLFTEWEQTGLEVGREVEMVIETLHVDEDGLEFLTYKFKPLSP